MKYKNIRYNKNIKYIRKPSASLFIQPPTVAAVRITSTPNQLAAAQLTDEM
jgi:hypothetical protein